MSDILEDDDKFLLDQSEREFLRLLAVYLVHYVLIGGHAVYYYGYKRHIGDMDITIERSSENIERFRRVLADLRLNLEEAKYEELCKPKMKVSIPFYNIHVLTTVSPFTFNELYENRCRVESEDVQVSLVSRDHLLRMKQNSSRAEDQKDYIALIKNKAI